MPDDPETNHPDNHRVRLVLAFLHGVVGFILGACAAGLATLFGIEVIIAIGLSIAGSSGVPPARDHFVRDHVTIFNLALSLVVLAGGI